MPLTDAQLVLLSAASQHPDGLLPRPDKLAGAALARMEAALLRTGLAEPVTVRADQPCWRQEQAGAPAGLSITIAGLAAIGVTLAARVDVATVVQPADPQDGMERPLAEDTPALPSSSARSFRSGSKLAQLVTLLSSPEGTGIDALVTALGWQPHTVRAALTRLRQGGFTLLTSKDGQNRTVYRIVAASGADAAPARTGEVA